MMKATDEKKVKEIARKAGEVGGRAYYVGGFVRDRLLGLPTKDIDVEIHGISPDKLREIVSSEGTVLEMGESFGIFSLKGTDIDIAMPRKETVTGRGHRDFDVSVDPFIGVEKAAARRDFTVNALMEDVLTGEIIDSFGGLTTLKAKCFATLLTKAFPRTP